ncbi:hypothetical protein M422DRAFT_63516 [Sphaerobolus stellatus SS14]|nr:hypothetical protein M422DRAFT_63516 [Sphaerobolus stellatus SS14]
MEIKGSLYKVPGLISRLKALLVLSLAPSNTSWNMLQICVVGYGAVGTVLGMLLERNGETQVTAVCRSSYEIMKSQGVTIKSELYGTFENYKPARVVRYTEEAADRTYDYVICAAKFVPELISTAELLGPLLSCTSTIVLIQNGIGIHEDIQAAAPDATIISAATWTTSTVVEGGAVIRHGKSDRLVFGIHSPGKPLDDTAKAIAQSRLEKLTDILKAAGCAAETTSDIELFKWQKNFGNIGLSSFCTLSRSSLATLFSNKFLPVGVPVVRGLMKEALAIGLAEGHELTQADFQFNLDRAARLFGEESAKTSIPPFTPEHFKPSMLVDLESGRPMEVEGIIGVVVRKGRAAGIECPMLETAYATLLLLQEPLLQAAKSKLGSGGPSKLL